MSKMLIEGEINTIQLACIEISNSSIDVTSGEALAEIISMAAAIHEMGVKMKELLDFTEDIVG